MTMESSAASRVKGVKALSSLLQAGYNYDDAVRMCALKRPGSLCNLVQHVHQSIVVSQLVEHQGMPLSGDAPIWTILFLFLYPAT